MPHILADHDDAIAKLIIFAVIAVIWAIKSILDVARNAKRKQQQQQLRPPTQSPALQARQVPPSVRRPGGPTGGPQRRPAAPVRPAVAARPKPLVAPRPTAVKSTAAQRLPPLSALTAKAAPRRAVPPPLPGQAAPSRPAAAPARAAVAAAVRQKQSPAPMAASSQFGVAGWVNCQTVRSQFLLSEALQPPLALRTRSHLP